LTDLWDNGLEEEREHEIGRKEKKKKNKTMIKQG